MIALSEQRPETPDLLYGGDLWRFGTLYRSQRLITRDIDGYLLPRDLETLYGILWRLIES